MRSFAALWFALVLGSFGAPVLAEEPAIPDPWR